MAILQWTPYQWRLIYDMIYSNEWKLNRYFDKERDNQIDVSLQKYCPQQIAELYRDAFGGTTGRRHGMIRKGMGENNDFCWMVMNEALDDFLDTLWIMLSKIDPCFRLTDVRQAQDIRKRVREGNSYAYGQSRPAQRH